MKQEASLLVFDGDDTLWIVEPLYDEARAAAAEIVAAAGIDPILWDERQRQLDIENVRLLGLSRDRFPKSCVDAYRELAARSGLEEDARFTAQIIYAAEQVFRTPAQLVDGVVEILEELRLRSHRLALLTKGDCVVQTSRLHDSGLVRFFESVHIVPEKDLRTFAGVCQAADIVPEEGWSIGNSLPSDINPALAIGMGAVWIDATVWSHEQRETVPAGGRLVVIDSLAELPKALSVQVHSLR
jgi:putative hydrolase of the HAD superfamily